MFEYSNPEAILEVVLPDRTKRNEHGHTLDDDFQHFCAVTGCPKDEAWAKLALAWGWRSGETKDGRDLGEVAKR
ncbi:hypothetical protein LMG22037_05612 [Paraburkholderia phenoliruptrix]|uniref:Uncharacterized protein n=1 Tax=Paraburkholderia phenoliruptrix TaxID=252970 RepID=A0A6J5CDZ9_9BURK|nr:hypothetical protein [Paraburkholderia phenoliruptrix]CAB3731419.1 hypothetical protein LMG22037_05612 [Paraburkholderia phenoliruptrix]